jgi:hypothetical protein
LENSDPGDVIRIFDHQNPEDIDGETTILANINWTQLHTIILVC